MHEEDIKKLEEIIQRFSSKDESQDQQKSKRKIFIISPTYQMAMNWCLENNQDRRLVSIIISDRDRFRIYGYRKEDIEVIVLGDPFSYTDEGVKELALRYLYGEE